MGQPVQIRIFCIFLCFLNLPISAEEVEACEPILLPPSKEMAGENCKVAMGDESLILVGNLLLPEGQLKNGQVKIVEDKISCVGCNCVQPDEKSTIISCKNTVISPGLINAHDHLTYSNGWPSKIKDTTRYSHRHDWRLGKRGHDKLKIRVLR